MNCTDCGHDIRRCTCLPFGGNSDRAMATPPNSSAAQKNYGKLELRGTPYCCGKELPNGWPAIECPNCKTQYNADDLMDRVLTQSVRPVRSR